MWRWLRLLPALIVLLPGVACAWCESPHLPDIGFTVEAAPAREIFTLGIAELVAMAERGGLDILENAAVLGLARSNLDIRIRAQVAAAAVGERWCAYLDAIEVRLGFDDPQIYVASELTPGSCSYKVTLEHERKHILFDQMIIEDYKDEVRRRVQDKLRNLWPVPAASEAEARTALQNVIHEQLAGLADEMRISRQHKHRTLDNPENYRREAELCGQETYALLRKYLKMKD